VCFKTLDGFTKYPQLDLENTNSGYFKGHSEM